MVSEYAIKKPSKTDVWLIDTCMHNQTVPYVWNTWLGLQVLGIMRVVG